MKPRADWRLYLVTDRSLIGNRSLDDVVLEAVRGGVTAVQLREKECSTRDFVAWARRLSAILRPLSIPLLINDRVDVALAAGVAGVHIGQSDMDYSDARRLLGPDALIGLSVETPQQAHAAESWDCDYLGVGPIFPTATKSDAAPAWGLAALRELRRVSKHQLVAIGGIGRGNARQVIAAGADGLAVVSAICAAADPCAAAAGLRRAIDDTTI